MKELLKEGSQYNKEVLSAIFNINLIFSRTKRTVKIQRAIVGVSVDEVSMN
jgi:hypothetical protein